MQREHMIAGCFFTGMLGFFLLSVAPLAAQLMAGTAPVFSVKDYGATGRKEDDARPAIQRAIDACAAKGGGIVSLPPGLYTSGTVHLRSHVVFRVEAGATLFANTDPNAYDYGG